MEFFLYFWPSINLVYSARNSFLTRGVTGNRLKFHFFQKINMKDLVGRIKEQEILKEAFDSGSPELIAVLEDVA